MYRVGRGGAAAVVAIVAIVLVAPASAQQTAAPQPTPSTGDGSTLDPNSPMAPLPGMGVDWPDLAAASGDKETTDTDAGIAADIRYSYEVKGIDDVANALLRQRFDDLSALRAHDGKPANAAQLDRRARDDSDLLTTLLKADGYYDARVDTAVAVAGGRAVVTLTATPGALYHFSGVKLAGVDAAGDKAAGLRKVFGVTKGDAVDSDTVAAGQAQVMTSIGNEGFPFAKVGTPRIVVDHATQTATLDVPVAPGGAKKFGKIVATTHKVFGAHHIQEIARFTPGTPYSAAGIEDLDRALIQTGLVSSADITPVQGSTPDTVDIDVALQPAPPRTIAGELGYGTGEGVRAEVDWTHRNLFPPEGGLTLQGILGTREQLASVVYQRNNFHTRDHVLTAQISAAHTQLDAYDARTFSLTTTLAQQTNIFFQKKWSWSVGTELAASDERDVIVSTGAPRDRTYFIAALPTSLSYDASDDLLNPTRGFRLGAHVSPELSLEGAAFGYARIQLDASAYQPVSKRLVIAERVRFGAILGAPRDAIAPSRRYYAGGGGSVRGYGYQDIGPRDPNNDPIGGRSLNEFSIEARVRAFGNFGIVPFLDAGNIYTSPLPKASGLRYGAGIGVRYYSSFGPIRLDVGTPINPQPGDSPIAVYVSLGQAF
jgi:translocation and assembly module TamA